MNTHKAHWIAWSLIGTLANGCVASSPTRRDEGPDSAETVERLPEESAYKDAAKRFLAYLDEQHPTGVTQASGKDGIYPMWECMEYGCPDKVLCPEAGVYCHVTHCGKGSCRGCPEPFPDVFKNLFVKEWCRFDCQRGAVRAGSAFGFVPSLGKKLFVGPICFNE